MGPAGRVCWFFFSTAVRTVVINVFFKSSTRGAAGAASMSSQKKARGLPGMKEGPLVQMLDRQRVQQAGADDAKKLVDAAALAAERLVDATKEVVVILDIL